MSPKITATINVITFNGWCTWNRRKPLYLTGAHHDAQKQSTAKPLSLGIWINEISTLFWQRSRSYRNQSIAEQINVGDLNLNLLDYSMNIAFQNFLMPTINKPIRVFIYSFIHLFKFIFYRYLESSTIYKKALVKINIIVQYIQK